MRSRTKRGLFIPSRGEGPSSKRLATFTILAASLAFCAQAQAELLISRYSVSLGGVRMGEAILHATIDAKHYKVEISADVGTLLNNTKVQGEASGSRAGLKLSPQYYKLVTSDGQESAIDFQASGADAKAANPLKGVLDPLSALLAASIRPSSATASPCDKVLTVLMSRAKIDASLHPAVDEPKDPRLISCRVQFAPNAKSAVNGQQLQSIQWEVNFQKLTKPELWLVEQVSLPTDLGTVTIERVETAVSGS
jgi:hypothetical protein